MEDIYIGFCATAAGIPVQNGTFGFYMDTFTNNFYWPTALVILRQFNRENLQWYQLWNNPLSSPIQHSQIQTKGSNFMVFRQHDANGIANSEIPDQTAPRLGLHGLPSPIITGMRFAC